MIKKCLICGKILVKTLGLIGPGCERKNRPKNLYKHHKYKDLEFLENIFVEHKHDGQAKNVGTN